jgi:pilus assembly protein Flp/PilA
MPTRWWYHRPVSVEATARDSPANVLTRRTTEERRYTNVTVIMNWLTSHLREEEGQGLAEYALILALIAVIAIAALVFLGTQISSILSSIGNNI